MNADTKIMFTDPIPIFYIQNNPSPYNILLCNYMDGYPLILDPAPVPPIIIVSLPAHFEPDPFPILPNPALRAWLRFLWRAGFWPGHEEPSHRIEDLHFE